jgi:CRISPR-associated protein Cas5t
MLGIYVTVPIACFRKGLAREYLETEQLPPPSTCYGFLLSLVGEQHRERHVGCRIAPVLLNSPEVSVVLRTVWRVKKAPLGSGGNTRPDFQQLLAPVELALWLDSSEEMDRTSGLEERVRGGLTNPASVVRFGGLSLGESTHLVDEVQLLDRYLQGARTSARKHAHGQIFLLAGCGRVTLPVWVDHVGSAGTRHVTGDLVREWPVGREPDRKLMAKIEPPEEAV